jgi:hypothetical protein
MISQDSYRASKRKKIKADLDARRADLVDELLRDDPGAISLLDAREEQEILYEDYVSYAESDLSIIASRLSNGSKEVYNRAVISCLALIQRGLDSFDDRQLQSLLGDPQKWLFLASVNKEVRIRLQLHRSFFSRQDRALSNCLAASFPRDTDSSTEYNRCFRNMLRCLISGRTMPLSSSAARTVSTKPDYLPRFITMKPRPPPVVIAAPAETDISEDILPRSKFNPEPIDLSKFPGIANASVDLLATFVAAHKTLATQPVGSERYDRALRMFSESLLVFGLSFKEIEAIGLAMGKNRTAARRWAKRVLHRDFNQVHYHLGPSWIMDLRVQCESKHIGRDSQRLYKAIKNHFRMFWWRKKDMRLEVTKGPEPDAKSPFGASDEVQVMFPDDFVLDIKIPQGDIIVYIPPDLSRLQLTTYANNILDYLGHDHLRAVLGSVVGRRQIVTTVRRLPGGGPRPVTKDKAKPPAKGKSQTTAHLPPPLKSDPLDVSSARKYLWIVVLNYLRDKPTHSCKLYFNNIPRSIDPSLMTKVRVEFKNDKFCFAQGSPNFFLAFMENSKFIRVHSKAISHSPPLSAPEVSLFPYLKTPEGSKGFMTYAMISEAVAEAVKDKPARGDEIAQDPEPTHLPPVPPPGLSPIITHDDVKPGAALDFGVPAPRPKAKPLAKALAALPPAPTPPAIVVPEEKAPAAPIEAVAPRKPAVKADDRSAVAVPVTGPAYTGPTKTTPSVSTMLDEVFVSRPPRVASSGIDVTSDVLQAYGAYARFKLDHSNWAYWTSVFVAAPIVRVFHRGFIVNLISAVIAFLSLIKLNQIGLKYAEVVYRSYMSIGRLVQMDDLAEYAGKMIEQSEEVFLEYASSIPLNAADPESLAASFRSRLNTGSSYVLPKTVEVLNKSVDIYTRLSKMFVRNQAKKAADRSLFTSIKSMCAWSATDFTAGDNPTFRYLFFTVVMSQIPQAAAYDGSWTLASAQQLLFLFLGLGFIISLVCLKVVYTTRAHCAGPISSKEEAELRELVDPKHLKVAPITVPDLQEPCDSDEQLGCILLGPTIAMCRTYGKCQHNFFRAICSRHLTKQPPAQRSHCIERAKLLWFDAIRTYLSVSDDPDEWVARFKPPRRRAILDSVDKDRVMYDRVSAFLKREVMVSYLFGEEDDTFGRVGPATAIRPRLIQGYKTLATQAVSGPAIWALQTAVKHVPFEYRAQDALRTTYIRVTIACGMNNKDIADWFSESWDGACFGYECDGSGWDSTMSRVHFDDRSSLYRGFQVEGLDLLNVLEKSFAVKGSAMGRFRGSYGVEGTTKSGHNDTTLSNSITNALISAECFARAGVSANVLVMGDDMLAVVYADYSESLIDNLRSHAITLGIVPKSRGFKNPLALSFISGYFWCNKDGWTFSPKLGRQFSKLFWTVQVVPKKMHLSYASGVVKGMYPLLGFSRCFRSFVSTVHMVDGPISQSVLPYWTTFASPIANSVENEMEQTCARYDISESDYNRLCDDLSKGGFIRSSVARHMYRQDVCELSERIDPS